MKRSSGILLVLLFASSILALFGQNCGQVHVKPMLTQLSSNGDFFMNPNPDQLTHRRYVFLVDMSNSMIAGPCYDDVDGPKNPPYTKTKPMCATNNGYAVGNVTENPYETYVGVDGNADRIEVIRKWIQDIQSLSPQDQQGVLVAIVPFSGGMTNQKRRERDTKTYKDTYKNTQLATYSGMISSHLIKTVYDGKAMFRTVNDALAYLDVLKQEQQEDISKMTSFDHFGFDKKKMGTSVPVERMREIYDLLSDDMYNLDQGGHLKNSLYEMIYLSDGVPRPLRTHYDEIISICQQEKSGSSCDGLTQELKKAWGDADDNKTSVVNQTMKNILNLTRYYGEADLSVSMVMVHPERISNEDKLDTVDTTNLLLSLRRSEPSFNLAYLNNSDKPFSLKGMKRDFVSYRLISLFAYQPNVRANASSQIESDSDGDGLFDSEEVANTTNAGNPRSNDVCLDSIAVNPTYADACKNYKVSYDAGTPECDAKLDIDMDGLNQCEEYLLGTDEFDIDTDDDGVPDSLEVVYRMFPKSDDSLLDSNGDNYNNLINFQSGLMPQHYLSQIANEFKVNFTKIFTGYKVVTASDGTKVQTEDYKINLNSAPSTLIQPTSELHSRLYWSRNSSDPNAIIPEDRRMVGGSSVSQTNYVTFLARIIDVDEPNRTYWFIYRMPASAGGAQGLSVNLSQMIKLNGVDRKASPGDVIE